MILKRDSYGLSGRVFGKSGKEYILNLRYYLPSDQWYVSFYLCVDNLAGSDVDKDCICYLHSNGKWMPFTYSNQVGSGYYETQSEAMESMKRVETLPAFFKDIMAAQANYGESEVDVFRRLCGFPMKSRVGKIVFGPWGRVYRCH